MNRVSSRWLTSLLCAGAAAAAIGCGSPTVQDVDAGDAALRLDAQPGLDARGLLPDAEPESDSGAPETDSGAPEVDSGVPAADSGVPEADGGTPPPPFPIRVAYAASAEAPLLVELYLTDTSTSRTKVNGPLAGGPAGGPKEPETAGVAEYQWTSRDQRLLYRAQQIDFAEYDLFVADAPGPRPLTPRRLGVHAYVFEDSTSSDRLVFAQNVEGSYQVFVTSSSAAQPSPRRLSRVTAYDFSYSPGSDYVVYLDFIDSMNARDLFFSTVAQDGPPPVQVNPGAGMGASTKVAWAPDGTRFAYIADERQPEAFDLFMVGIEAGLLGTPVTLNSTALMGTGIGLERALPAAFSPDGARVAYVADSVVLDRDELFVVDVNGPVPGAPRTVSSTAASTGDVQRFVFDALGDRLVYATEPDGGSVDAVYLADLRGGAPVRVSPVLPRMQVLSEAWAGGDGAVIIELYDDSRRALYLTDVRGAVPGVPVRLTDALDDLLSWSLSRDGTRLVLGVREAASTYATFVVDVTAAGGAVPRLLWRGTTAPTWCWAQDGGLALATDVEVAGQAELFWVPDLTLPTFAKISGPLAEGGRVHSCAFPTWVD